MGGQISIKNDEAQLFTGDIIDVQGDIVEQWNVKIEPGETLSQDDTSLVVGDQYRIRMMLGDDQLTAKEDDLILFAFKNHGSLSFTVSGLFEKKGVGGLEVEYLFEQILPGIRIEDTVFHGKKYAQSFFAKELVTYLVVHEVASSIEDAVAKCRVLAGAGILVFLCDPMIQMLIDCDMYDPRRNPVSREFQNKSLLYRLGETHPVVRDRVGSFALDEFGSRVRRFKSKHNRLMAYRGLEGWLEKRKRLVGFWQRRYFRVLAHNHPQTGKLMTQLAYFETNTSLEPKGFIDLRYVQHVDLLDKKKRTFAVRMLKAAAAGPNVKAVYTLRGVTPEVAFHWLSFLRPFSHVLSPVDTIQRSALVCTLKDAQIQSLAKLLKPKVFKKGKWIIKRGEKLEHFYLLEIGAVGIYTGSIPQEKFYWNLLPVSFFGESMLTDAKAVAMNNFRAEEDCQCLKISLKDWEAYMKEHPTVRAQLRVLFESTISRSIDSVSFLKGLKPAAFALIKAGLHFEVLEEGQELFFEGDPGDKFYIVQSGMLKIVRHNPRTEEEVLLSQVAKGAVFGEISLMLPNIPRTATIIAKTRSILISLDERTFKAFVRVAGLDMNSVMRERIVGTFHQYSIPFFDAIELSSYRQLALSCRVQCFEAGEVIFREGEQGTRFYIIYLGEVSVSVGGKPLIRLGQGKYFGEVAIVIDDMARTATVRTTKRTVLLSMSKKDFRGFFADRPEALADVELKIAGRKCQIRSIIYHPKGIELFTRYLKSQYAEESIEFWHEARAYRKWAKALDLRDESDRKRVSDKAGELMERFIRPGCDRQVNISASMAKRVMQEVAAGEASASTFVESEDEVISLISKDKLGPFKFSPEFKQLMAIVGGYQIDVSVRKKLRGGSGELKKETVDSVNNQKGAAAAAAPASDSKSPMNS